jgi:hypothetical protein
MDPSGPLLLAGATYAPPGRRRRGRQDRAGRPGQGEFDYMDVAVLTKGASGELQAERHDSTAKHLARGGALPWSSRLPPWAR